MSQSLIEQAQAYLKQLAPHVQTREGPKIIGQLSAELKKLEEFAKLEPLRAEQKRLRAEFCSQLEALLHGELGRSKKSALAAKALELVKRIADLEVT